MSLEAQSDLAEMRTLNLFIIIAGLYYIHRALDKTLPLPRPSHPRPCVQPANRYIPRTS
jgi:hypothetical protein